MADHPDLLTWHLEHDRPKPEAPRPAQMEWADGPGLPQVEARVMFGDDGTRYVEEDALHQAAVIAYNTGVGHGIKREAAYTARRRARSAGFWLFVGAVIGASAVALAVGIAQCMQR